MATTREAPTTAVGNDAAPRNRRAGGRLRKLTIVLVSILLTLVILEVVFRALGFQPIYDVYSEPEAFWKRDALLGWSLEPGAEGEFVGPRPFPIQYRTEVRINSLGFRGPNIPELPEGGLRVVVLGDSMTAGFEVDEDRTYAAVTEELLRPDLDVPVQVINAGVRGYGTDQVHLLYQDRVRALEPDIVVYHTTSNDADDNITLHRMQRPFGKPAFALQPDGSLQLVGRPVPDYEFCSSYRLDESYDTRRVDGLRSRAFCWLQRNLADHSALFSFVTARIRQNPGLLRKIYNLGATEETPTGEGLHPPHAVRLTSSLIEELASLVHRDGARFMLMGQRSDLQQLDLDGLQRGSGAIIELDEALGPSPGDEVRFPVDGHYNEEGHRLVAALLAERLARLESR